MKKEMRPTIIAAAAVLGCFLAGWSGARLFGGGSASGDVRQAVVAGDSAHANVTGAESRGPGVAAREWSEALAAFGKGERGMAADHALAAALLRLEGGDFLASAEAVMEVLAKSKTGPDTRAALIAEAWMGRWLELDGPGALRFLESSPFLAAIQPPDGQLGRTGWTITTWMESGRGGIFTALARRQPEWLQQYLTRLPEGQTREIGMYALLRGMAQGDVERARRVFAGMEKGKDRAAAVVGFVTELARVDVMAAFDLARAEPPSSAYGAELLTTIFNQARVRGGTAAVKALLDRVEDPAKRNNLVALALANGDSTKPGEYLNFVNEELTRMAAELGGKMNFQAWARSLQGVGYSPQARAFAEWSLEFPADKNGEMFQQVARNWAAYSPKDFAAWVRERAGTLDAAQVTKLGAVIGGLTYNVEAARTLSDALPAGPLRDQARFQVAMAAGKKGDFTQAMEAYRGVATTDAKGTLAAQLAGVLVATDGAAAADWAGQQPPGKARDEALRVVAETWSMRDVRGAAKWLETLPAGAERDRVVQTYATTVVVADAQAASEWVGQVADPRLRQKTAETVFDRWSIQDPVAARAWLGTLPGGLLEKFMRNAK